MQNHYLQLVSEETGRLARLIQNMLDLSKLESGEYQVNARMFNIWETLTGVAPVSYTHLFSACSGVRVFFSSSQQAFAVASEWLPSPTALSLIHI